MEPELNGNTQNPPASSDEAANADAPAPAGSDLPPDANQDSTAEPAGEIDVNAQASIDAEDQEDVANGDSDDDETEPAEGADDAGAAESNEPAGPAPEVTTEQVVEAVLFGADAPLTPAKIVSIVGTGSARDVRKHIETLNQRYAETGASFRIEKIAGGYQMLTLPAFNAWLKRLKQTRQESKLSQAALETLAVVAYKQPVVRAEIEAIRGVAAGEMLNRLRELGLVKIVGRAEDVGRPLLYGTTKRFLDVFGLGSLEDLPMVEELKAPD